MKSQIDSSECAKILGSNSKHTHIKINEPADAFRMINFNRQQHNVQSDVASDSNSGPSLSERFKALNSKSNGQDRAIMPNEQAMPNRPISRAKRTGGSEQKKTPETNSLPETARSTQSTLESNVRNIKASVSDLRIHTIQQNHFVLVMRWNFGGIPDFQAG